MEPVRFVEIDHALEDQLDVLAVEREFGRGLTIGGIVLILIGVAVVNRRLVIVSAG